MEKARGTSVFHKIAALLLSLLLALCAGELLLRVLPVPGIARNQSRFDSLIGSTYCPRRVVVYRGPRGAVVRRRVNAQGYLDAEHGGEKAVGTYRVGFFGDSYTEARQVPLDETYFKIVERRLRGRRVECLAFGLSGLGTVQEYLASTREAGAADLDLVVYVFCENDPGEQIREIEGTCRYPYAELTDGGFRIDTSFAERNRFRATWYYATYEWLTRHSVLAATLSARIRLLARHGVKLGMDEDERLMATRFGAGAAGQKIPRAVDVPSSWPVGWRRYAERLCGAVILEWRKNEEMRGRRFVVMPVPRPGEFEKPPGMQDSWAGWLKGFCASRGIPLIDPTPELLRARAEGKEVYYDHFTREGHRAFADAFVKWFERESPPPQPQHQRKNTEAARQ